MTARTCRVGSRRPSPERVTWHLLDQSTTDGTLGHWTPNTNTGQQASSPGRASAALGPHAMATDGSQLFVGGDFTTVNNKPQQGIAIFPTGLGSLPVNKPTTAPTVTSTSAGVDSVSFPATWSTDVGTLSYKIFRDGGTTPIATLTATSWPEPGEQPVLHYQDTGLTPGSSHTYTYQASDGTHNTAKSPASSPVTVASSSPTQTYQQTVLADNPSFLWPLNDSGGTAADASSNGFNGTYEPGTTQGAGRPVHRHQRHLVRRQHRAGDIPEPGGRPAGVLGRVVVQDHHQPGRQADRVRQQPDRLQLAAMTGTST